jgi:hypothetical protein
LAADAIPIGARYRLVTLDHLDGRTHAARRTRDLIGAIESDLGGHDNVSEGERQIVMRAGVLGALIENFEAQWLAGERIELSEYLAAVNCQRRLLECVGLRRRPRDVEGLVELMQREAEKNAIRRNAGDAA